MIKYVKSLRAYHGLSQTEMAEILGLSLVSYNKRETGKIPFTVDELQTMSEYFKVPVENFFKHEVVNSQTNQS